MRVCTTVEDVREARASLTGTLGFVPTMGALHAGHLELVRRARAENQAVAASIFVNPAQFSSADDFRHYPRDLNLDLTLLEAAGVDLVFTPSADAIYPAGFATTINVGPLASTFEGAARPGHFQGVATIVTILFNVIQPAKAYFGQKDAQQLLVVRKFVNDLRLPVDIVAVPTVRDSDGLALSSRNALLTPDQRQLAVCVPRALRAVACAWDTGVREAATLRQRLHAELQVAPGVTVEYAALADAQTLTEPDGAITGPAIVLIAVRIGNVRLIDNCLLSPAET
jgi:pantoate--beta-alanine ligase